MKNQVHRATAWVYTGIWAVMTRWFRVPGEPPSLPARPHERVESMRPAEGFLRYLKFKFWLALLVVDLGILAGWLSLLVSLPVAGAALAPVALVLAVLPDVIAYIAIHLRYDTTWYVMTNRSLRIRRGIWTIHETTITFENVQNIRVEQGPLQRHFGIADVVVETAGGGGARSDKGGESAASHRGLIEGVSNAAGIRDKILEIVRRSKTSGVGDDAHESTPNGGRSWSAAEIAVLREIRNTLRPLAG
jgi:membrane protein YdbS with pleckstrin-like domain